MFRRLIGVALLSLLALGLLPGAAAAVEEGGQPETHELPPLEEVVRDNERARSVLEEPYSTPSFFAPILVPLLIVAVVVLVGVSILYLLWQPRFAQERKAKEKARR